MTLLRFIHAADLHLDSPFVGMKATAPENVAHALREATFSAYENIITFCIDAQVDALLVAGDVYDSADRSLRAQLRFVSGLTQLHDAGIRSYVCHGNHDPLDGWEARLDYPPSCTRFGTKFEAIPVFEEDPGRAVVHGISYPTRDVYDNMTRGLDTVDSRPFSIGLMHANVDGNAAHASYAPCSLDDLLSTDIDYWALGHVHTRQILSERPAPVVYPGNPQGRHPNESGARGVYLVEVDRGRNVQLEFRAVDSVRWERSCLDISHMETEQELIGSLHQRMEDTLEGADGRSVVLRVTLVGPGSLYNSLRQPGYIEDVTDELNAEWTERTPFVWCERIEDGTSAPFNRQEHIKGSDFLAEVLKTADRAKNDPDLQRCLSDSLSKLYQHRLYRKHLYGHDPEANDLVALIDEAEAIAVNLLAGDET